METAGRSDSTHPVQVMQAGGAPFGILRGKAPQSTPKYKGWYRDIGGRYGDSGRSGDIGGIEELFGVGNPDGSASLLHLGSTTNFHIPYKVGWERYTEIVVDPQTGDFQMEQGGLINGLVPRFSAGAVAGFMNGWEISRDFPHATKLY